MHQTIIRFIIVQLLITFSIVSVLTPVTQAAVIDTRTILVTQADSPQADVQAFLARGEVREQLIALGVNPDDASGRVAALTDQELSYLQNHINDLPAGSSALASLALFSWC